MNLRRLARDAWLLPALLIVIAIPRLPTLAQPIIERHGFRQTWTAWTAVFFHTEGFDLLHPKVPIFGPPYVLVGEFPLYQALGALLMNAGLPADVAMRSAGLICFLGACVALFLLLRDLGGRAVAFAAVAIFATTPLGMLWSRSSMIEYLAVGAGIAFLWAGLRWRDGRGQRWLWIALALGVVGALVKPPTFVVWAIPLALARDAREARAARAALAWLRTRLDPRLIALGVVPILAAVAWLRYGDSLKALSTMTRFLSSSGSGWNSYYYSTLPLRFDGVLVQRVLGELIDHTTGHFTALFALVGVVAAIRAPRASFWIALAAAVAIVIEIFWGAYWQHDYYFIAVSGQMAALAGFGLVWLAKRARGRLGRSAVGAAAVLAVAASLQYASPYWAQMYLPRVDPDGVLTTARTVDAVTASTDRILTLGLGYDPSLTYYAQRDGLMLTYETLNPALVDEIPTADYHTLVVRDPWLDALWVMRHWPWSGAREAPIYRLGDTKAQVADAYVIATDDRATGDRAATSGRSLAAAPITIPCDFAGADIPVGRNGTLLVVRDGYAATTRVSVGYFAAPVPVRAVIWASGFFTKDVSSVRVTCTGSPSITIERLFDAGLD